MNGRFAVSGAPLLAFAALNAACSGGGSSTSTTGAQPTPSALMTATFSVTVPSPILSAGAQSVAIAFVPVGETAPSPTPPLIINVSPGAADCATAAGKTICSGTLAVPPGQQNFTLSIYSLPGGKGSQLTVTSLVETIAGANGSFDVSNASGAAGVLASVEVVLTPATIAYGVASTVVVSIVPKDASGNTLVGALTEPVTIVAPPAPTPPAIPIFLPASPLPAPGSFDANNNPTVLNPAQQYAFAYTGTQANLPQQIPFEATAANIPPVTAFVTVVGVPTPQASPTAVPTPTLPPAPTPVPVPTAGPIAIAPNVLLFEAPTAAAQVFSASEAGVTTFRAVSSDTSIASVNASGSTFSVTPHNAGSAAITVSDSVGRNGTVFVYVSHIVLTIQERSSRR